MKGDKPPRLTEKDGPMTDSYEPRQPREAAQRGVSGTNAAYKRRWYLENRERVLKTLHEKNLALRRNKRRGQV
jgi:hypothetical protein